MPKIEIAMAAIWQIDKCHLQLRDGNYTNGEIGRIGMYGGRKKAKETYLDAVVRELKEETTLHPQPQEFHHIGEVDVVSERIKRVHAVIFSLLLPEGLDFESRPGHGQRVSWDLNEIKANQNELTPASKAAFEDMGLI